jgi:hypothetical protein
MHFHAITASGNDDMEMLTLRIVRRASRQGTSNNLEVKVPGVLYHHMRTPLHRRSAGYINTSAAGGRRGHAARIYGALRISANNY